ncbi:3'-5' exonuclease KapD [Heliophilum fasciatum]|uniref:Sporulation inhibitor KapD n=1 Tax=Heliophilum fasciatum TaxID=35700 RepID=A0A4R2S0F4_9FIRM|nr:3'-5' exonuclease KapD [Heliophilum fasciatum]MCW2276720.1 sporulation inhibitor KapD [Heliophilum fasciatum]TCP68899.1 sporulation inhibitor KapD [Heliophilum fasciatum]
MNKRNWLVLDFEFSLYQRSYGRPRAFFPEIIEVGAIVVEGIDSSLDGGYQTFVKPRFFPRLTEECKQLTMIRQADVDGGVPLEVMLEQLLPMYSPGETMIVAWGEADRDVLHNVCQRYGLEYPFIWDDYVDLSMEHKRFYGLERRISLKKAVDALNLDLLGVSHSALDDARNTALIIQCMLEDGWCLKREATTVPEAVSDIS